MALPLIYLGLYYRGSIGSFVFKISSVILFDNAESLDFQVQGKITFVRTSPSHPSSAATYKDAAIVPLLAERGLSFAKVLTRTRPSLPPLSPFNPPFSSSSSSPPRPQEEPFSKAFRTESQ